MNAHPTLLRLLGLVGVPLLLLAACASGGGARGAAGKVAAEPEEVVLVGEVAREAVEEAVPDWVEAEIHSEIDREAALGLALVDPGTEVTVYFGTWCSDSRRELARLWRALDETGSMVPFPIRLIAVDREKTEPAELVAGVEIPYVPTFIVRRQGREVGRIVEESPEGIEVDLLALLTGEATGILSASHPELASGAPSADGQNP